LFPEGAFNDLWRRTVAIWRVKWITDCSFYPTSPSCIDISLRFSHMAMRLSDHFNHSLLFVYRSCTQTAIFNVFSVVKGLSSAILISWRLSQHVALRNNYQNRNKEPMAASIDIDIFTKNCLSGSHSFIKALYSDRTGWRCSRLVSGSSCVWII
jgi:hypothetical protein